MGKKTAFLLALAACCMGFVSCGEEPAESPAETTTTAATTVPVPTQTTVETQKPTPADITGLTIAQRAEQLTAQKGHVSDETGTIDRDSLKTLNERAEAIAQNSGIQVAAVITNDLSTLTPEAFAAEYYNSLYGAGTSGFLVLVNNMTGKDLIHTSGMCSHYLPQDALTLAITKATPHIVTQDYAAAVDQIFSLADQIPDTIFDYSGILSKEQYAQFCEIAEDAIKDESKHFSVLLVDTRTWQTANSLQSYADAQRGSLADDGLLVVDVQTMICAVSGDFSGASTTTAELNAILKDTASKPITAAVKEYYKQVKALQ